MADPFQINCPRCQTVSLEPLYTVPIYLPPTEPNWLALCRECFVIVLQVEPSDELKQRPSPRSRRNRRG